MERPWTREGQEKIHKVYIYLQESASFRAVQSTAAAEEAGGGGGGGLLDDLRLL